MKAAMGSKQNRSDVYITPRWVKITGLVALALVALVAIAMVTGLGGDHGPGRHMAPHDPAPTTSS